MTDDLYPEHELDPDVLAALEDAHVPAGPSLSPKEALSHPHFVERGLVRWVDDPFAGRVAIPGFPFKSTDELPPDDHHTAALGEHNDAVLHGLLGIDRDRLAELEAAGVLSSKPH